MTRTNRLPNERYAVICFGYDPPAFMRYGTEEDCINTVKFWGCSDCKVVPYEDADVVRMCYDIGVKNGE